MLIPKVNCTHKQFANLQIMENSCFHNGKNNLQCFPLSPYSFELYPSLGSLSRDFPTSRRLSLMNSEGVVREFHKQKTQVG
jgi:hypothetical protein